MKFDIASFNAALQNGRTVVMSASCSVEYSGRAESFLAEGDRIVIIKSDNTLLIHQPTGSNPINYMKEGSSHRLSKEKGSFVLRSANIALKESIVTKISKIYSIDILDLVDSEKIQLQGSEKDMADMIYQNPAIISSDFRPLSREEHTKYGFIDVFGYDKDNNLVIIECKRYSADFTAVDQLLRYIKKMKQLRGVNNVRGIIAAPKISENALQMLKDHGCAFCIVAPPKYLERHEKKQQRLTAF